MTPKQEIYSKFRLSIDNGFRNEFSFVDYRRWGVVESWNGGRLSGSVPSRASADQHIEVWFNWNLVGVHDSYAKAEAQVALLLKQAPVPLGEFLDYLDLGVRSG